VPRANGLGSGWPSGTWALTGITRSDRGGFRCSGHAGSRVGNDGESIGSSGLQANNGRGCRVARDCGQCLWSVILCKFGGRTCELGIEVKGSRIVSQADGQIRTQTGSSKKVRARTGKKADWTTAYRTDRAIYRSIRA